MPRFRKTLEAGIPFRTEPWLVASILWAASIVNVSAAPNPAIMCSQGSRNISAETCDPSSALNAILTLAGEQDADAIRPLLWAVTVGCKTVWFGTEGQSRVSLFRQLRYGMRNFRVLCFQIEESPHGKAFNSKDNFSDPTMNGRFATKSLTSIRSVHVNWTFAAFHFHQGNLASARLSLQYLRVVKGTYQRSKQREAPLPQIQAQQIFFQNLRIKAERHEPNLLTTNLSEHGAELLSSSVG